jgi:CheY-like chemotaxis protein/HPt (histidine-containing phosphotransfer) domain-containing protein
MSEMHEDPERVAATNGRPRTLGPSKTLDVLVVEDNLVNQKFVVALLSKWGHRVVVAGDGAQCLKELERREFDLVLMDIQMPVMDGIAATRSIRSGEGPLGRHIPIIAITAHAQTLDRARCVEAGMDGYLSKPMDSELLRRAIAELVPMAAAEPDAPPAEPSGGPVDFERLKEFVGGDAQLLAEVVQIFLDDAPVTLEIAARAISDSDSAGVETSAHRLKGSLSTIGSQAAADTADLLETLARGGALDGATELFERLCAEVAATSESLRLWKLESAA